MKNIIHIDCFEETQDVTVYTPARGFTGLPFNSVVTHWKPIQLPPILGN